MKRISCLCGMLLAAVLGVTESAALELGDPAPPLEIAEWIRGKPVEIKHAPETQPAQTRPASESDAPVYVLKFWATWCPPCRLSIPHMAELQRKHGDRGLVVVAISGETPDTLKSFVKEQGDKINYTVAADRRGATFSAYMGGFGLEGIPHTFIIDRQGRIAWHGSPFSGLATVVQSVLDGTYSLRARVMLEDYFLGLLEAQETSDAVKKEALHKQVRQISNVIVSAAGEDYQVLDLLAWNILTLDLRETRDLDLAERAIRRAMELSKGTDASVLDTYARFLWVKGDRANAIEYMKKAIEVAEDDEFKSALVDRLKTYEKSTN